MIAPMNFPRTARLSLLAIALSVCVSGQNDPNAALQTDDMWNGRLWVGLANKSEKTVFLMAYLSALRHMAIAATSAS